MFNWCTVSVKFRKLFFQSTNWTDLNVWQERLTISQVKLDLSVLFFEYPDQKWTTWTITENCHKRYWTTTETNRIGSFQADIVSYLFWEPKTDKTPNKRISQSLAKWHTEIRKYTWCFSLLVVMNFRNKCNQSNVQLMCTWSFTSMGFNIQYKHHHHYYGERSCLEPTRPLPKKSFFFEVETEYCRGFQMRGYDTLCHTRGPPPIGLMLVTIHTDCEITISEPKQNRTLPISTRSNYLALISWMGNTTTLQPPLQSPFYFFLLAENPKQKKNKRNFFRWSERFSVNQMQSFYHSFCAYPTSLSIAKTLLKYLLLYLLCLPGKILVVLRMVPFNEHTSWLKSFEQ